MLHARRRDHAAAVCQKCEDTFSPGRLLVFCIAILCVVLVIGGAFTWLARLDKMREHEHSRTGRKHAHIVQKKLGNKISIVVFTFQVIYQYSSIVTGYEHYFHYPEPARGAVSYMSMFGLEVLNFSPPEVSVAAPPLLCPSLIVASSALAFRQCVDPNANYYTKLVLVTATPMIVIALGWLAVRAHNVYKGVGNVANMRFWANSLLFLEFVLSGVSTIGTCRAAPSIERLS